MPRGIFHIVRVHRSMRFELAAAVVVAAGVIQRDATLPEVGRPIGNGLRQAVKRGGGFGEAPVFEVGHRAIQKGLRTLREHRCREPGTKNQKQKDDGHVAQRSGTLVGAFGCSK